MPQPEERNTEERRGLMAAFEEYLSTPGWKALDAQTAVETFVNFCVKGRSECYTEPSGPVMDRIDPKGNVVLAEFGRDAILFLGGEYLPYVVAHGYDRASGEWSYGNYSGDLSGAWDMADPEILEDCTVKWGREDFVEQLEAAEIEVSEENVDALIEESGFNSKNFKDFFFETGNERIGGAIPQVAEDVAQRNSKIAQIVRGELEDDHIPTFDSEKYEFCVLRHDKPECEKACGRHGKTMEQLNIGVIEPGRDTRQAERIPQVRLEKATAECKSAVSRLAADADRAADRGAEVPKKETER